MPVGSRFWSVESWPQDDSDFSHDPSVPNFCSTSKQFADAQARLQVPFQAAPSSETWGMWCASGRWRKMAPTVASREASATSAAVDCHLVIASSPCRFGHVSPQNVRWIGLRLGRLTG